MGLNFSLPEENSWRALCASDPEFRAVSRYWDGGIRLNIGRVQLALFVKKGQLVNEDENPGGVIEISGEESVWEKIIERAPSRFNNDIMANIATGGGLSRKANRVMFAQYYPALIRAVELLRNENPVMDLMPYDLPGSSDIEPVSGKYIRLLLGGHSYRVYYEEAGKGIPLILQHTAGCHGSQWRHLFENKRITDNFRLVAYDLPFHGKSLPPATGEWWAATYKLEGEFLRSIPVLFSRLLNLDRPVFMGCSVGGLLALDLAHKHPNEFRAVVSIEGALKIEGNILNFGELDHPQVGSGYKGRLMEGLTSPMSPKAYRKEASYLYSNAWSPVFLGDLNYYMEDYDLRECVSEIDTRKTSVHILSGEYDWSSPVEAGRVAHEMIPGSTWSEMKGLGHFPMTENPALFYKYLEPVLEEIIQENK